MLIIILSNYKQLSITHYQVRFYANNFFEYLQTVRTQQQQQTQTAGKRIKNNKKERPKAIFGQSINES